MRRSLTVFVFLAVCLTAVRSASAQDTRSFGVTMGYPASVGMLWHLSERLAIRPELSFDVFSSDTENASPIAAGSSSDGHAIAVGFSALFYVARWDLTSAYVVPRYAYSRTESSIEGPLAGLTDSTIRAHAVSVSFGAQHRLGERFGIYGELGLEHDRSTTEITTAELRRRALGTRSGVGVVVYF